MLEEIAKKVQLKKRVVQVWYQNSRARERKGQFRQNMQIIHKRCPYCSAIFKVKSALEAHLTAKHADQPAANIDAIPEIKAVAPAAAADAWPPFSGYYQAPVAPAASDSEVSFTDSNGDEDDDIEYYNDEDNQPTGAADAQPTHKRHRTHMSPRQKSVLRRLFADVKTPSMHDCEAVGRQLQLTKRVVQVNFLRKY